MPHSSRSSAIGAATGCALLLLGCGASEPAAAACSPGGRYPDYVEEATPSPDGEGWCCQPGHPTCDCGYFGGFVRDRCSCGEIYSAEPTTPFGYCDLAPPDWILETDAHGCSRYRARVPTTACCICRDASAVDAGAP